MPETTPEYHNLCYSLATAKLFIRDFPDTTIRNELDEMRLKSYIFLCHAAIEEYLEKATSEALRRARQLLRSQRQIPKISISAISHYQIRAKENWATIMSRTESVDALGSLLDLAIREHSQAVYENHGIKTKDQDNLCLPLGIRVHDLDRILSQNLNSFGEGRGKIAHEFQIRQIVPKAGCLQSVNTLSTLLLNLDNEIARVVGEFW
jgi:hypothetical protein